MTRFHIRLLILLAAAAVLIAVAATGTPPNTVILKDDGFHPRTLTVGLGTTVTFVNKTDQYFWPASDYHPVHALYPAFDPREPLAPGSSYAFTFDESGTYPFHDHLAAYFMGLVRVEAEDGSVPPLCVSGGTFSCWQQTLFEALSKDGLDAAYDALTELFASDPAVSEYCHGLTHNIGLASYQLYLEDPDSVFSPQAVACGSGFYHGFMEGMLGASGDIQTAVAICDEVGERLAEGSPDARYQCFHGIGHGALETAVASTGAFSTIDEMMAEAITLCESTSTGTEERYRCASGAYNALANFYIAGAYGLDGATQDPLALCSRQPDVYKESCYGNMNSFAYWYGGNDFSAAAKLMLAIRDADHIPRSIEYLAALAAIPHLKHPSYEEAIRDCRDLPAQYQDSCLIGFAHGLVEHGAPGTEYQAALAFCATPALGAASQDACYRKTLGVLSGWYSKEKAADICREVAPELRRYCGDIIEP